MNIVAVALGFCISALVLWSTSSLALDAEKCGVSGAIDEFKGQISALDPARDHQFEAAKEIIKELQKNNCLGSFGPEVKGRLSLPCAKVTSQAQELCKSVELWANLSACARKEKPSGCEFETDDDELKSKFAEISLKLKEASRESLKSYSDDTAYFAIAKATSNLIGNWIPDSFDTLKDRAACKETIQLETKEDDFEIFDPGDPRPDERACPTASPSISLKEKFEEACSISKSECINAFTTIVRSYILIGLSRELIESQTRKQTEEAAKRTSLKLGRWKTFSDGARAMLYWESLINGTQKLPEEGFEFPPDYQWILLHPSAALAADGFTTENAEGVLLLELFGGYFWRWEGTEMKSPFKLPGFLDDYPLGGALTLGFDSDSDLGLGLVAHLPRNWSIGGIMDKDGELNLLLSLDVAKFFTNPGEQRKSLIEGFKGQLW